jgi:hypothetical protein
MSIQPKQLPGKKPLPKLSSDQTDEAIKRFHNGETLRTIATDLGCSHEHIRSLVKDVPGYVPSVLSRRLKADNREQFFAMIKAGVTPEVAAGVYGVNEESLNELLVSDPDFAEQMMKCRYTSISELETSLITAAKGSWKAALEVLSRAKETRELYKKAEAVDKGTQINIQMNWDRD